MQHGPVFTETPTAPVATNLLGYSHFGAADAIERWASLARSFSHRDWLARSACPAEYAESWSLGCI